MKAKELENLFAINLTRVALESARRQLLSAVENEAAAVRDLHLPKSTRLLLQAHLKTFSSRQDQELAAIRRRKWLRDSVKPKPLPSTVISRSERKHQRSRRAGRRHPRRTENDSKPTAIASTVVNLSSYPLTTGETSLLSKGPTFCPTTTKIDRLQLTSDLYDFYRRLRLKEYFSAKPDPPAEERSTLQGTDLARKSLWQPRKVTDLLNWRFL